MIHLKNLIPEVWELDINLGSSLLDQSLCVILAEPLRLELLSDYLPLLVEVLLHLLDEALPLIIFSSYRLTVDLSTQQDITREPLCFIIAKAWKKALALFNHVKLGDLNGLDHPLHAIFVRLANHCDNEVHEHDVSNDNYKEP